MMKCETCKDVGLKKTKITEDFEPVCGIKKTKLTYLKYNCPKCGYSHIDVDSIDKSRKDILKRILAADPEDIRRSTLQYLLEHQFKSSLFVMTEGTVYNARYARDVLSAARPLTIEFAEAMQEQALARAIVPQKVTFVIED